MKDTGATLLSGESSWADLWRAGVLQRFIVLGFGVWLHASNASLVSTLIPSAVLDIGGVAFLSWASVLYQVGSIVAGAAAGLLAVRFGLRSAMMMSAAGFGIGCVLCAVAPDMNVLLGGRLIKGAGGGALVALTHVAIVELFPSKIMPRMIALVSAIWGVSAFCGPAVGGGFAEYGLWRTGFWAYAAQAGLYLAAVGWVLRSKNTDVQSHEGTFPKVRLVLLSAAIMAIASAGVIGFTWQSGLLSIAGLVLLAAFFRRDAGAGASRLYPRSAYDPSRPTLWGLAMIGLCFVGTITFTVYGPILIQLLHGARPITGGILVAVESIAWSVAAIAFSGAAASWHPWLIRAAAGLIIVGVAGLALVMPGGPVWALAPFLVAIGGAFGMSFGYITQRIVAGADGDDRARASAAIPTTQMIGYALGASANGFIANGFGFSETAPRAVLESVGFWGFAAFLPIVILGAVAALRVAGPIGEEAVNRAAAEES
ncbi:MFS transporter [Hwanghaeella sp.]|uniref:MFS transporter n=1 Tax=Hwanghaeella sp. TaxID=2605943 RepID=UPI003CCBDE5B